MFVVSVKQQKLKRAAIVALAAVAAAAGVIYALVSLRSSPAAKSDELNLRASTADERIAFLSQYGWSVTPDPLEVKEVLIPTEFDDTYESYNEIQKTQNGLDLEKYAGERVKRWTYEITNYPGYENTSGLIRADILVYDGLVIGGDVCSVELSGFMHGFSRPAG